MRSAKLWLMPAPLGVAEGKRMVRMAAAPKGGETVKAQVRNAARNLRLDHWTVWNAWNGKIGSRAYPKLHAAFHRWLDEQGGKELEALRERVERLEQDRDLVEGMAGEPLAGSRLRVCSAPRRSPSR